MMLAMLIAISIQMTVIGGYRLNEWLRPEIIVEKPGQIIKERVIDIILRSPPPLNPVFQNIGIPVIPAHLSIGIPIPVSEMELKAETEFASQTDLSNLANKESSLIDGNGNGETLVIPPEPSDPLPDANSLYEKPPAPVLTPAPQYPDLSRRAGIEGYAFVKVLVTKEGKVKKAILLKSDCELFVQPSIDAAMKWVFTPALMNGNPVPVWVSIPFRFRLTK
jgi:TonB family protein